MKADPDLHLYMLRTAVVARMLPVDQYADALISRALSKRRDGYVPRKIKIKAAP